eukprot:333158-Chlamydomonas_euryale.AAC.6
MSPSPSFPRAALFDSLQHLKQRSARLHVTTHAIPVSALLLPFPSPPLLPLRRTVDSLQHLKQTCFARLHVTTHPCLRPPSPLPFPPFPLRRTVDGLQHLKQCVPRLHVAHAATQPCRRLQHRATVH